MKWLLIRLLSMYQKKVEKELDVISMELNFVCLTDEQLIEDESNRAKYWKIVNDITTLKENLIKK